MKIFPNLDGFDFPGKMLTPLDFSAMLS